MEATELRRLLSRVWESHLEHAKSLIRHRGGGWRAIEHRLPWKCMVKDKVVAAFESKTDAQLFLAALAKNGVHPIPKVNRRS
jgi:hypothetical protein